MALETCGAATHIPGFASSISAVWSSGSSVTWGSPVTAAGGRYRLCWCSAASECHVPSDFQVSVGELRLVGPSPTSLVQKSFLQDWGTLVLEEKGRLQPEAGAFQHYECAAGQPCEIAGLQGLHISSHDSYMILDTCGFNVIDRVSSQPDTITSEVSVEAWNLPQSSEFQQLEHNFLNFQQV